MSGMPFEIPICFYLYKIERVIPGNENTFSIAPLLNRSTQPKNDFSMTDYLA